MQSIPETKAKVFKILATDTAKETFGASIYANMIMLGALTKITSLFAEESMERAVRVRPKKQQKLILNAYKKDLQFPESKQE